MYTVSVEPLENRTLFAGGPTPEFAAGSIVRGKTIGEWSGEWWAKVFSIPAPVNPMVTEEVSHSAASNDGKVTFLFGSLFASTLNRTETIPTGTPVLVPLVPLEWSNADTPAAPDYMTLPGNYTAAQLQQFATAQANLVDALTATLDGQPIDNLFAHREASGVFSYVLPAEHNIIQDVFGGPSSGPQTPAVAEGYWLMLQPLSPGQHVLHFTSHSGEAPSPPLFGPFEGDVTYMLNVSPKGQVRNAQGAASAIAPTVTPPADGTLFGQTRIGDAEHDEPLELLN